MRRAPIVVAATGAGLAALLSFHTESLSASNGPLVSTTGTSGSGSGGSTSTTSAPTTTAPSTATGPAASGPAASTPTTAAPTTTVPPTTTTQGSRKANGSDVPYRYGELELQVTVSGGKITDIRPVMDNATDPRSAQINDEAIPYLRQQALQAQSANIDGVSGATYTSEAYVQSLQAALDKLGWSQ
ncbi:MAG TPA: FMN-binding protein [Acidimicrobiales bacterium]|nr:FMN-binding protein [Acidimicrobiales bacterium]